MMTNFNGIYLTKVIQNGKTKRPQIKLRTEWLIPMGFVPFSLVQCLPEPNGLSLTPYENIPKYSALVQETRDKGGLLIHSNIYKRNTSVLLTVSGEILENIGLKENDSMLIRYEYGFIRMRKLPAGIETIVTSRIFGQWLEEFGFVRDAVLTVDSVHGSINCTLQENGVQRTHELVKYAREHKAALLQIQIYDRKPQFEIPPAHLSKAGFDPNDAFLACCEYGKIILLPINFNDLGF